MNRLMFGFGFDFNYRQNSNVVPEDPPYHLLTEDGDRILAENADLIEKEHS